MTDHQNSSAANASVLDKIEQRLNESGTGEMGALDTIHAVAALVREARVMNAPAQAVPDSIGVAVPMPGASAFTMCCFMAENVPVGTKLYVSQPSPAATVETKTVYVKRWRTLVNLPAKYADEIVEALRPHECSSAGSEPAQKYDMRALARFLYEHCALTPDLAGEIAATLLEEYNIWPDDFSVSPQTVLGWLATKTNYELSYSGWDNEDPTWDVHSVNGGRNDREWTLLATGSTPEEALRKAMSLSLSRPHGGGK